MAKIAQTWLDSTYQDKNVKKIALNKTETEALTGELLIKGYTVLEEISLEWGDKKGEITKVIIEDCSKVKDINLNNNKITEITFKGNFPSLERLDMSDNELTKIEVSKFPNLTWLNVARNSKVTVEGGESLTKLEIVNLLGTPGLNNQKFKEWKEGINSALGSTSSDSPLPDDWKKKLDDLKNRPTQSDLEKKVKEAVDNKEKDYKDYINPKDSDKTKLEQAAKGAGFGFKQEDIDKAVKEEKDKHKDYINPNDPNDKNKLKQAAAKEGMVPKEDLDNANKKVKEYEDGLKNDLKLSPNDPLPNDWKDKLVPKTDLDKTKNELNDWKDKFPNETPDAVSKKVNDANQDKSDLNKWKSKFPGKDAEKVEKEIDELKSRPATGGSGTGGSLTTEQQEKLEDYKIIRAYLRYNKGNGWKEYVDKWKEGKKNYIESSEEYFARIEQVEKK